MSNPVWIHPRSNRLITFGIRTSWTMCYICIMCVFQSTFQVHKVWFSIAKKHWVNSLQPHFVSHIGGNSCHVQEICKLQNSCADHRSGNTTTKPNNVKCLFGAIVKVHWVLIRRNMVPYFQFNFFLFTFSLTCYNFFFKIINFLQVPSI